MSQVLALIEKSPLESHSSTRERISRVFRVQIDTCNYKLGHFFQRHPPCLPESQSSSPPASTCGRGPSLTQRSTESEGQKRRWVCGAFSVVDHPQNENNRPQPHPPALAYLA